jgi:hypothetical protein
MDKSFFQKQSLSDAANHQRFYNTLTQEEKVAAFVLMMEAAYSFVGKDWPRMEKVFSGSRKVNGK